MRVLQVVYLAKICTRRRPRCVRLVDSPATSAVLLPPPRTRSIASKLQCLQKGSAKQQYAQRGEIRATLFFELPLFSWNVGTCGRTYAGGSGDYRRHSSMFASKYKLTETREGNTSSHKYCHGVKRTTQRQPFRHLPPHHSPPPVTLPTACKCCGFGTLDVPASKETSRIETRG